MSINTAISNWIEKAEPDYYTMFIKAWIPYNAWYMHNFCDENANPPRVTDKEIINYIKNNYNVYKNKIISLLRNSDDESKEFKSLISKLYYNLESTYIPDYDNRISFNYICIAGNSKSNGPEVIKEKNFSVSGKKDISLPKSSPRWVFEIIDNKTSSTLGRIALMKPSLTELHSNNDFVSLENKYKPIVERCLNEIDPNKKISVVIQAIRKGSKYVAPPNSLCIDENKNLFFTDNIDDVSKAIIQILYELRCKLFHGEIDPLKNNMGVYEYAYQIQKILIKSLN